ncbi:uncharacterized protein LOC111986470 [Quercus suber]|uniref:uncharacterized protein LOC111986470 n=1 Tax=Quercus suber TaxID=58331 RepID=UPI000CE1DC51|nr:uncharacterized protein LOC111986470 [Quercus suber]
MGSDPSRRNQNLYCTYHKDKRHTTEQCRVLKDHLGQLVKAGHLRKFVVNLDDRGTGQGAQQRGNPPPPPLEVIEVIHTALRGTAVTKREVLTIVPVEDPPDKRPPEKKAKHNEDDLKGTIQPHDDVLVVTAWVSSFLVKKVMINQRSEADVMYSDLFKGLGLKNQDLTEYDTSLVSFDGRVVILEGQISLPVSIGVKEVMNMDVFAWSPYEVPGVDLEFIVHKLDVDPSFSPKKQRPRKAAKEHVVAVKSEVQRW